MKCVALKSRLFKKGDEKTVAAVKCPPFNYVSMFVCKCVYVCVCVS